MDSAPVSPQECHLPRAAGGSPGAAGEDGAPFGLRDLVGFLARNLAFMAATTLLFTVGALALVLALHRTTFRAATLLLVGDQPATDGFKPPVLPVDGYVRLLTSRSVLQQATRDLVRQGRLAPGSPLTSDRLSVRPIEVRRGELGTAAVLDLQATGASGEEAAAVANACAQALIDMDAWSARRAALEHGRRELADTRLRLREREARLAERLEASRRQIAAVAPLLSVRSRLGDAELLTREAAGSGGAAALVSQEPNPVYTQMAAKLADLELDYQVTAPQLAEAERGLAAVEEALARLGRPEADEAPEAEAAGGPAGEAPNPAVQRALVFGGAVSVLKPAVPPARPLPARLPFKAVLAAAAGGILAFLMAAVREGWRGKASGQGPAG